MTRRVTFLFAAALAMHASQGFANEPENKTPNDPVASDGIKPEVGTESGAGVQETIVPDSPKPETEDKKPVFDPDYSPCSALPVHDKNFG